MKVGYRGGGQDGRATQTVGKSVSRRISQLLQSVNLLLSLFIRKINSELGQKFAIILQCNVGMGTY